MLNSRLHLSVGTLLLVFGFASAAAAQAKKQPAPALVPTTAPATTGPAAAAPASTPAPNPTLAAQPAESTAPTPAAPVAPAYPPAAAPAAPAGQPAQPPQMVAVPPGYALVPIDSALQARYEGGYAQSQGAPPPEMELPYEDGDPVPQGYRLVSRPRRGLVIAGSIVGGVSWGLSIVAATNDDFEHKSGWLVAPVLGPWLMLATGGAKDECESNISSYGTSTYCQDRSDWRSWLVLDGLTQAAGATMFIVGLAYPTARLVRRDVTLSMVPMPLGQHGYGVGAVGRF